MRSTRTRFAEISFAIEGQADNRTSSANEILGLRGLALSHHVIFSAL